jgi:hypothetical protein
MSGRLWLALAFVVGTAAPALADEKAECDYLEISASTGKAASIDAALKPLEKKLKKPPFSSWNVFHTLSSGHLTLQKLKSDTPKLKQGSASLLLRERTEKRLELTITIDGADGKRVLDNKQSANVGEWLLFGQNVGDNGHIVALTCK